MEHIPTLEMRKSGQAAVLVHLTVGRSTSMSGAPVDKPGDVETYGEFKAPSR